MTSAQRGRELHAATLLDREAARADRRQAAAHLESVRTDELTGALSRQAGREALELLMTTARSRATPFCMAFIDVDHLKLVNDVLGHASGDRVLAQIGETLRGTLGPAATVVRYGGDEFVCGIPTGRSAAVATLSHAERALAQHEPPIAFTSGVVQMRSTEPLDGLLARADAAMYENRVRKRLTEDRPRLTVICGICDEPMRPGTDRHDDVRPSESTATCPTCGHRVIVLTGSGQASSVRRRLPRI